MEIWDPRNFANRGCSSRRLKLKIFPAACSRRSQTRRRQPLPYGTSTRYPQVAIDRSVDRRVGVRRFEWYPAVEPFTGTGNIARKPTKIFFVKFAEQGSTVLAYHAIRRAIEMVGAEKVFFLVFEENRFVLDVMQLIPKENVITVGHKNILDAGFHALYALKRIRRLHIDAAIDLEFFSRSSAALTYLSGARSRVGFHTFFGDGPYRGDLMTHRLLYNPYIHTSQNFQLMVEALEQAPDQTPNFCGKNTGSKCGLASAYRFGRRPGGGQAIIQRESGRRGRPFADSFEPECQ